MGVSPLTLGHKTLTLIQTDQAAAHGHLTACYGGAITTATDLDHQLGQNAAPGSTEYTITLTGGLTGGTIFLESTPVNLTRWETGEAVLRLNFTTVAHSFFDIKEVHVCRVDSGGTSQGTYGSLTGLTDTISAVGVKQFIIPCSEMATTLTTDRIYIVVVIENTDAGVQSVGWTPSEEFVTDLVQDRYVQLPEYGKTGAALHRGDNTIVLDTSHVSASPTLITTSLSVTPDIGVVEVLMDDTQIVIDFPTGYVGSEIS